MSAARVLEYRYDENPGSMMGAYRCLLYSRSHLLDTTILSPLSPLLVTFQEVEEETQVLKRSHTTSEAEEATAEAELCSWMR